MKKIALLLFFITSWMSVSLSLAQDAADACYGGELVFFRPGLTAGGEQLASNRRNPQQALGAPQMDETFNFISLGFGGEIILAFDKPIANGPGNDIQVVETTFNNEVCETWHENAEIFVSQNLRDWVSLGVGCMDSEYDMPADMLWARYIRILDVSDPADFKDLDDGFDVDGIVCLNGSYTDFKPVMPVLTCVQFNPDLNNYTAVFGYDNQNQFSYDIPAGANNFLFPALADVPVTEFEAGATDLAFTIPFDGNDLSWTLNSPDGNIYTITANSSSNACSALQAAAVIRGGGILCSPDDLAKISIDLSGSAPWNLVYQNTEGMQYVVNNIQSSPYEFTTAENSTYSLISVENIYGTGPVSGSATVSPAEIPTATISGGGFICPGGTQELHFSLTGQSPWSIQYQDPSGNILTLDEIETNLKTVQVQQTGNYTLLNVADLYCSATASGMVTVAETERPTATISGGGIACGTGAKVPVTIEMTGNGPWKLYWKDSEGKDYFREQQTSPYQFEHGISTTFSMSGVSDAVCTGTVSGMAQVEVAAQPTAVLSGGGRLCESGEKAELKVELTGTAPFSIEYLRTS